MKNGKRGWSSSSALITAFLPLVALVSFANQSSARYHSWGDATNEKFSHMAVDLHTGRVFIGAVNHIYQLSRDLKLEAAVTMGPQDDSPNCPVTKMCPGETKRPTDYYNKVLLIAPSGRKLIACGSLFQGVCTQHDVTNVTVHDTTANVAVVANTMAASTVAFMAPGPESLNRNYVLYVGVSYTSSGPYRVDIPAVSTRSLNPSNIFAISPTDARIWVNSLSREIYPITYIYGFSFSGFSFFVTVQKKEVSLSEPIPFFSKLVRVCQDDADYYSYTEIPLVCKAPDGTDYNLVQAAYVGSPGSELAKSMGIAEQDRVMFAVFADSKDGEKSSDEPSRNSALCVYTMSAVQRKFTQNIQHCYSGNGQRGLGFINPDTPCISTLLTITNEFCGLDVNTPLGGKMPVEAAPVLRFPGILLTAVAVTSAHDYTLTFLGTSTGHLKKIVVETATTASEYSDTVIEEGSPINANMLFDETKNYIYVMTERKVTKVNVGECEIFRTATRDPYCDWCSLENRCFSSKACPQTADASLCCLWCKSSRCQTPPIQRTTCCTSSSTEREETDAAEGGHSSHPNPKPDQEVVKVEKSKLHTLQDIAQSLRNIVNSLKQFIEFQQQERG